jgi:MFS transporter, ACS family, tartrate transporter
MSPIAVQTPHPPAGVPIGVDDPPVDERQLQAKVVARLIPFLSALFVVNYLDRTNISMAKLRMLGDTGISETAYGLGAGLFFWGYFLFEVPSNLILEKVGARIWMTRIMITWGLVSAAMMLVRGPWSFYGLRFLLGVAEAGFFPGIVLYLTYWIPCRRRAGVLAWFLTSTAVSGIIGNPLAGALMQLDGVGHLHGWQWLFLLEGMLPIALGFVTLALLPDRPAQAKWLGPREVEWIEQELAREHAAAHRSHHVRDLKLALRGARLWQFSVLYFLLIMGLYGFVYWVPTIIQHAGGGSDMMIGWWSALPYVVAAASMVVIGQHADRHDERRWHVAACAIVAAGGIAIVARCSTLAAVMPALCLAAVGIFGSLGPFWALTTRFLRGEASAGGIAIVNSIGALAGSVSPSVIGWAKTRTGSFTGGLMVVAASLVCGAVVVLLVPRGIDVGGGPCDE